MPIIPPRALGDKGLVLDVPDFELEPNAFSNGSNVRFRDGAVRRASVLRQTRHFAVPNVRAAWGYAQATGYDRVFVGDDAGRVYEVNADSSTTDRSISGLVPASDPQPWTWAQLGDVVYANKPSHVPIYFPGGPATKYATLPGWDATHRARALAVSRDQLFAINLTKGLATFPNLVAISDYALFGQPPATWNPTDPGVANEITLAGARSPLVGGLDLDGTMIVYGERQSWRFVWTGDTSNAAQNLWVNEPLSVDRGMISPRGVAYLERKHYVFGTDDLYVHDGVTIASIADGRVRRWVMRNLDLSKAERCFVVVDPTSDEVIFAFPSKDGDAAYASVHGCNRAAIYGTRNGTWTLGDLRDIVSGDYGNFNPSLIWTTATMPWLTIGGSWGDLSDGFGRSVMFVGPRGAEARILALDEAAFGRVSFSAPSDENPPAFVERTGYDIDELGQPLSAYKIISTIFPQVIVMASMTPVRLRIGASLYPQGPYTWSDWRTFYPAEDYRIDFNKGGRYLGLRLEVEPPVDFVFSGMDVDLKPGGRL